MEFKVVFAALETVCDDIFSAICDPSELPYGEVANRLVASVTQIQENARALLPVVAGLTAVYHQFDLDAKTPGNGYRTLVNF